MNNTVIVIPARMDSKRFPGKPLVKIEDKEMLLHVWEKAVMSKVGEVIIACCDKEIRGLLEKNNIKYIMTPKALKSGTDRVYNALLKSKKKYDKIINLQGDIPNINPNIKPRKIIFFRLGKTGFTLKVGLVINFHGSSNLASSRFNLFN